MTAKNRKRVEALESAKRISLKKYFIVIWEDGKVSINGKQVSLEEAEKAAEEGDAIVLRVVRDNKPTDGYS